MNKIMLKKTIEILKRLDKLIGDPPLTDEQWKMLERGTCPVCLQKHGEHLRDGLLFLHGNVIVDSIILRKVVNTESY